VLPQPLGVVGIIVPWNYPLYLAIGPMVAALAAGNRVMVKMSEFTPGFAGCLQAAVREGLSRPKRSASSPAGPEVAAQFSALPFDHLLFTGSTPVGRKVMGAAARNLTPVTLELGGKSPTVITPGYPLEHAVERILAGKLLNAGQTCIAPDYVLLPRAASPSLRAQARRHVRDGTRRTGRWQLLQHRQRSAIPRLWAMWTRPPSEAALTETLFDGAARDDARHRLAPTLLIDPPADCGAMRDEIFGPVLPLVGYDHVDDALAYINARPRPLALYWFDRDRRVSSARCKPPRRRRDGQRHLLHIAQESCPSVASGASGMGHYHGRWGFAPSAS
jgi:coniferyl-aldehyde dehydrogenase